MTNNEYKAKCQWLSEFYAEAARTGREMQVYSGFPDRWEKADGGPAMYANPSKWRLKPEPPKAWVVWMACNNGKYETASFPSREEAEGFSSQRNATIQEITRPD